MALNQTFNIDALGDIGIAGSVTTAAPTYTAGTFQPLSLGLAGLLRVDGSNVTQPISASTLPLPTGASTSALQTTGNATLLTISGQLPTLLGPQTTAASLSIVPATGAVFTVTGTVSTNVSTTGTITSVALSLTSTTALAANAARRSYIVYNDSLNMVFLAFAATASTTAYSVKLQAGSAYEPAIDYTGIITFVGSAATGSLRVTEFT